MAEKFIEWSNIYTVGIDIIDNQHKKIFELINKTYYIDQMNDIEYQKLLNELNIYANNHFKLEEKLFEITKYPGTMTHLQEHNNFREKIKQWNEKSKSVFEFELFDFLVDWLIEHILHVDMKYASFIKSELQNQSIDLKKLVNEI